MMDKKTPNIKIVSNYINIELYENSKKFYEPLTYEKIGIFGDNQNWSFNFLNHIIKDNEYGDIDIMVYIDEDCFIVDNNQLINLIDYFIENKIDCVGMPDGGVVKIRAHNPIAINQFFCILNLKTIREKYNEKEILNTVYTDNLKQYTPYHLIKKEFIYNYDDFEPYYKLFFWMVKNEFKFEYLDGYSFFKDFTTTILKNHIGHDFAFHTWYGRKWNEKINNKRIKDVIDYCNTIKKIFLIKQ